MGPDLVNCDITVENHHALNGKTHELNGHFQQLCNKLSECNEVYAFCLLVFKPESNYLDISTINPGEIRVINEVCKLVDVYMYTYVCRYMYIHAYYYG